MDEFLNSREIAELTESVRIGKTIAFVGSGLSIREYCSWSDLIVRLCDECGVVLDANKKDIDFLEVAEQAKNASIHDYHRVLAEEFGKDDIHIPPGYNYLLESPFASYITINYDPLLVEASRFKALKVYDFKSGLDSSTLIDKAIFYIHGYVERGGGVADGDLILTKSDFDNNYEASGSIIPSFLIQVLSYNPVLFIGCGLQEPALRKILRLCNEIKRRIESRAGNSGPTHHILLPTLYTRVGESEQPKRDIQKEKAEDAAYEKDGVRVIRYVRNSPADFRTVEKILEFWSGAPKVKPINVYDAGPDL